MEPNRPLGRVSAVSTTTTDGSHGWGRLLSTSNQDPQTVALVGTERQSFDQFWSDHHLTIGQALSVTLGDRQLAGEAVDEAMARAFQRWASVSQLDNPAGWVYRVGLNWSRSALRRLRRRPTEPLADRPYADPPVIDPAIGRAVAALPIAQRSVVACRLLLGMSEAQTADALHIPAGTVKSRLARATAELSRSLAHLHPDRLEDR